VLWCGRRTTGRKEGRGRYIGLAMVGRDGEWYVMLYSGRGRVWYTGQSPLLRLFDIKLASALHTAALEDFQNSCFQPRGTKLHSSCVLAPHSRKFFFYLRISAVSYAVIMYAIKQSLYCLWIWAVTKLDSVDVRSYVRTNVHQRNPT